MSSETEKEFVFAQHCLEQVARYSAKPLVNEKSGFKSQEAVCATYYATLAHKVRQDLLLTVHQARVLEKIIEERYAGAYSSGCYLNASHLADLLNDLL